MQGKQKIIENILHSASVAAATMVEEATEACNQSVQALRDSLSVAEAEERENIKAAADAIYAGQVKLGELEAGKVGLRARRDCCDAVYDCVRRKILDAPDAQYLKLLQKLIASVCEDGDEIIPARADSKRVTAAWVKTVAAAAKKKLVLSEERGDFDGGVILRNARYDRNLTVDEIIAELKERTLSETVRKLGL